MSSFPNHFVGLLPKRGQTTKKGAEKVLMSSLGSTIS